MSRKIFKETLMVISALIALFYAASAASLPSLVPGETAARALDMREASIAHEASQRLGNEGDDDALLRTLDALGKVAVAKSTPALSIAVMRHGRIVAARAY